MTEQHENFVNAYFDAVQMGSDDQIYNCAFALEQFEREAYANGILKEEEIIFKHVLIKD